MLTLEERALATHIGDRLIELYVERDEARSDRDWERMREPQNEIDEAAARRREILHSEEALLT